MDRLIQIIRKKPFLHVLAPCIFLVCAGFFKWTIHPTWMTLFFALGGIMGIYFLDFAEEFANINPSPFRSILFFGGLGVVMLFIVTSSGSAFTSGLVFSVYLTLLLWFIRDFMKDGDTNRWFTQLADPVGTTAKKPILGVLIALFVLASVLFVR
jgi:hypothetical protein